MAFDDMLGDGEKRQAFVAFSALTIILSLCLIKWFLIVLIILCLLASVYLGYKLFAVKSERKRLKQAFKTTTGNTK